MKGQTRILLGSLLAGMIAWFLDAGIGAFLLGRGSFWDLALFALPPGDLVSRLGILAFFCIFGAYVAMSLPGAPSEEESIGDRLEEEGEIQFRGLADLLPESVFEADLDLNLTYANKRALEVFGYTAEDLRTGLSCMEMLVPSDRDKARTLFQERVGNPDPGSTEYTALRRDGSTFPVLIHPSVVERSGQPRGVRGVVVDISAQKEAENVLRESERKFRNIVESSPMGVFLYGLEDGKLILRDVNPSASTILGVDLSESLGKPMEEIFPPLAGTEIPSRYKESAAHGTVWHADAVDYDFGGIQGSFEVSAFQTAPNEVAVMFLDITERRKAEKAVRTSEERVRLATRSARVGIWEYEIGTDHLEWDELSYELYGVNPDTGPGGIQRWRDCVHPEDLEGAETEFLASLPEGGEPFDSEFRILRGEDGLVRHIRGMAGVLRNEDGRPIRALGTNWDITESKQAAEALRESEGRVRRVIEQMNDATYILFKGHFELINPRFCDLTGVTPEEAAAPGFSFWDLVAPASVPMIQKRQEQRDRGEEVPGIYEFEIQHRAGHTVQVEASVREIEYQDGLAVLGVLRDVTEQRSLKEQLLMAQKMESVGRLSGGVAHDLNNLLTPILGYSDLVLGELAPDDDMRGSIQEILQAALRARDLVRQLLAFGRRQAMEFKAIDLNEMVEGFQSLLRRAIHEDIQIRFRPSPDSPIIQGDQGQLEQVIMNFAVNAQDAMQSGGAFFIETDIVQLDEDYARARSDVVPGSYAMLSFSDTGIGMDAPTQEKIFEPFFTTKERGKGTGLGLSTVYGIVKQHDGNIWAYSEPGKGTTFKCYFPLSEGSAIPVVEPPEAPEILVGSETIMVVEDEETVRDLAVTVLNQYGYSVFDAPEGDRCLELLRDHQGDVDLLLTDVVMPGLNGREVYEEARKLYPEIKVLYMSGYTEDIVTHRGVLQDGIPFVQKPFAVDLLIARVRAVLDGESG